MKSGDFKYPIVFGGTFSPPHKGHLHIIHQCRLMYPSKKIVIVPSYHTPFKDIGDMLPYDERLALLKLALEDYKDAYPDDDARYLEVSDIERDAGAQIKTSQLLQMLHARFDPESVSDADSDYEFGFIAGDDILDRLEEWANVEYLKKHVRFIIFRRIYEKGSPHFDEISKRLSAAGFRISYADNEIVNASSTEVNGNGNADLLTVRVRKALMSFVREA